MARPRRAGGVDWRADHDSYSSRAQVRQREWCPESSGSKSHPHATHATIPVRIRLTCRTDRLIEIRLEAGVVSSGLPSFFEDGRGAGRGDFREVAALLGGDLPRFGDGLPCRFGVCPLGCRRWLRGGDQVQGLQRIDVFACPA